MKHIFLITALIMLSLGLKAQQTPTTNPNNKAYAAVEKEPEFPGGPAKLNEFIANNFKNTEKGLTGRIYVTFVVEKDGSLSDIKAIRAPSELSKKEAERVMSSSPDWKPGTQNGVPVRVAYTIPINIK